MLVCAFPKSATFDILWEGLQVIDEEYLAEAEERDKKKWELLKNAKNAVRTVEPRGGFKSVSYKYLEENEIP